MSLNTRPPFLRFLRSVLPALRGFAPLLALVVRLPAAHAQATVEPVSTITTTAEANGTTLPFQRHVVRVGPAVAGEGELVAALQRQGTDSEGLDLFVSQDEGQTWTQSLSVQDNFAERDCADMLPDADGNGFSLVYGVEPASSDFQPDPNSTIVYLHYAVAADGSLSVDQGPVTVYQPGAHEGYFRPSIAIDTTGALHVTASLLDDPGGTPEGTDTKPGIEPNYVFSWWESVSTNAGATWSTPTELATFGDSFGGGRVLAYGDNLMAIFDAYDVSQEGRFMTEPAGAGENWGAVQSFVSAGIYHAGAFSVTATPDGIVHLGYSDKPEEELWFTEFNGSTWSTAQLIESTGVWSNQPALSHDGETLTYAWNHYVTDTDNIIEEETRPPGGSFGAPLTVDTTALFKGYTSAIDQFMDGEPVIVLWSQDPEPAATASTIPCAPIDGITSGTSTTGGTDGGTGSSDAGTRSSDAGTGGSDAGSGSTSVSFSDSFSECAAATEVSLSSDWVTSGTWDCDDGHARGETAGVALADTAAMGNTTVSVSVQLDSSTSAGVVGRDSNGSFYAAVIESAGSVDLLAVHNGTITTLASVPETIATDTSYELELVLTGFDPVSIQVALGGATVINTTDSSASALSSGEAGLYNGSGGRAQFEYFVVTGTSGSGTGAGTTDAGTGTTDAGTGTTDAGTGTTDAGTGTTDAGTGTTSVSFSDSFSECAAATEVSLSSDWSTSGTWDCDDGHARGETAGVALADTAAMGNTTVSVSVQLDSSTSAGLVGRDSNGSFYAAVIESAGSVDLLAVHNGTITTLASVPETIAADTSYALELVLTGFDPVTIQVAFQGAIIINTTDSSASALSSGEAGLYNGSGGRAQFQYFVVTGTSGSGTGTGSSDAGTGSSDAGTGSSDAGTGSSDAGTGSTSVSFTDSFSECAAATEVSLSSDWSTSGTWDCDDGHARGETAGVALADTAALGNTTVSVSVQLDSSTSAGLVGRDSNGSFYAAVIESAGSVDLLAVHNGTITTLASVSETIAADTSYALELALTGFDPVSIQVAFQDAIIINTTDSSASELSSGEAGLYNGSGGRAQFQYFVLTGTSAPACTPTVKTLASGQDSPQGIAVDGAGSVYWIDCGSGNACSGTVMEYSGGTITTLASGQGNLVGFAADPSGNVYWTYPYAGTMTEYSSGTITTLVSGQDNPWEIAVDGSGSVYWTNSVGPTGTVMKYSGGTITTLASGQDDPLGIAVNGSGSVYWTDSGGSPFGTVMEYSGGTITTLASAQDYPSGIAVGGSGSVYWTDSLSGTVLEYSGGTITTLASGEDYPSPIAADTSGSVYWSDSGAVREYSGGTITTLASAPANGIAVDSSGNVYWTDADSGTVMERVACP